MGLALSLLIGPVFFALIQTGIEQGFRAGATYCSGVWTSDSLIILGMYSGVSYIISMTKRAGFELVTGLVGGGILIIFGLVSLLRRSPDFTLPKAQKSSSYLTLFLKGFFINCFNPFTVIFWVGITTTVVAKSGANDNSALLFFGALMGALITTDLLKVSLARWLRSSLRPAYITWLRRISGIALLISGVVLIGRVLW